MLRLGLLHLTPNPFALSAHGFLTHLHSQETFEHLSSTSKRHPCCQMHQMLLLSRGERSRKQGQFLIQGEKNFPHRPDRFHRFL